MQRSNPKFQYVFAWILLIALLFVAFFGSYFMPHTINESDKVTMERMLVDGEMKMLTPPFPPSQAYVLGTDHRGYDLLSLLLNGAKYTLGIGLAVTLARFLIAIPIGIYSGVTGVLRGTLRIVQIISASVPLILILFPALYSLSQSLAINSGLPPDDPRITFFSIAMFSLLVIAGVFPLADQIADRARFFYGKEYVTVSQSLGASTAQIIRRHVLPQFRPELLHGFLTEYVQVLFLVGQLAVLSVFVGGSEPYFVDDMKFFLISRNGEWASMIAYGTDYLRSYPWIVAAPGLFFACSVGILSFFAHMLQKRLDLPSSFKRKPVWQRRSSLIVVPSVSVICIAVILFLPNKQPAVIPVNSVGDHEKTNQSMSQSSIDVKVTGANDQAFKSMLQKSTEFMKYLEEGKWEFAKSYFDKQESNPPEPWRSWMEALSTGKYKFVRAEKIYKNPVPRKVANDTLPRYDVEVIVKSQTGEEESWLLVMKSSTRIDEAVGGPSQVVIDK